MPIDENTHGDDIENAYAGTLSFAEWKRWQRATFGLTFLALLAIAVLLFLVLVLYPRKYQSQAKLLLRLGRESITLDPTVAATGQPISMHQTREHEMETALGVMSSRSLLEDVVEKVGEPSILEGVILSEDGGNAKGPGLLSPIKQLIGSLDPVSGQEKAIRQLEKNLKISASRDSSVVQIEYRTDSPELAHLVVDTWVQTYLDQHNDFHRTPGTLAFFQSEHDRLVKELAEAHERLRRAKDESGLVTVEGQQAMLETELGQLRTQLNDVDSELAASDSRAAQLQRELTGIDSRAVIEETTGSSDSREAMRARLFDLEVLERDLASRYTDEHPRLISTRRQLDETRDILAGETNRRDEVVHGINPTFQTIETELALEKARRDAMVHKRVVLAQQLDSVNQEINALNRKATVIAELDREVDVLESQYVVHSERLDQARLEDVLQKERITSVREVQPATLQYRPVSPSKPLCAVFGLLAMMGAIVGIPLWLGPSRAARAARQREMAEEAVDEDQLSEDLHPEADEPLPKPSLHQQSRQQLGAEVG